MPLTVLLADARWPAALGAPPATMTPALARIFARGAVRRVPATNATAWLCATFGALQDERPPAGPYALAAEGVDPGDGCWWCADPVHVDVGTNGAAVAAIGDRITQAEAQACCEALNAHFGPDLTFAAPQPGRWYLRTAMDVAPDGGRTAPGLRWRALLTELQMLLHAHPVNAAREERGEPPVNSLAVRDGGVYRTLPTPPFDTVFADAPLARGLARAAGAAAQTLPAGAQTVLATQAAHAIVVLDAASLPAQRGDTAAWPAAFAAMDEHWFAPLLDATSRLHLLHVIVTGSPQTTECSVRSADRWRFWRHGCDLRTVLAEAA